MANSTPKTVEFTLPQAAKRLKMKYETVRHIALRLGLGKNVSRFVILTQPDLARIKKAAQAGPGNPNWKPKQKAK